MLERYAFVEHWMIWVGNDVCWLKGTVWRLPVSRSVITTPILAIDPAAGWARAVDEWFTIGPCINLIGARCQPEGVTDRAERWLDRQLRADDIDTESSSQN